MYQYETVRGTRELREGAVNDWHGCSRMRLRSSAGELFSSARTARMTGGYREAPLRGSCLFDFERQFSPQSVSSMVATEARKLSAEERQRDVFETHRHRVFAVSYYMTANEVEAEQILTRTFVRAFAGAENPDAGAVDQALVGELAERFSLQPAKFAIADAGLPLSRVGTRRTDMEEALPALPPAERLIFLLRDVEGYPAARIAALLERTEREVQRTLLSARIRLRNALAAVQSRSATMADRPEGNRGYADEQRLSCVENLPASA